MVIIQASTLGAWDQPGPTADQSASGPASRPKHCVSCIFRAVVIYRGLNHVRYILTPFFKGCIVA